MNAHVFKPDMPPPVKTVGVVAWMRANLFSSWVNTLLTFFAIYLVWLAVPPLLQWAFIDANWTGTTRADCTRRAPAGCSSSSASANSCMAITRATCAGAST